MMDPVELRHAIHSNPELAFQEYATSNLILENLNRTGIKIKRIAGTGIIAIFENASSVPFGDGFTLFRSELDALPMKEETGWKYASKNGNMHACGHDVHTAILYGLIMKILEEDLKSNLLFLFQPAEETNQGAKLCLEEIERLGFRIKDAIALHVTDEYSLGEVSTRKGVLFSSSIEVDCIFKGEAIHIAFKDRGKDSIKGALRFLEEVDGMKWDGLVGFGALKCGKVRNVVADECTIYGTLRAESFEMNLKNLDLLRKVGEKVAKDLKMDFELKTGAMTPELRVDGRLYEIFRRTAENSGFKFVDAKLKFTSEDFAYFSRKYPSLMFWMGVFEGGERVGLHSPKFLPSDDVVNLGIELMFNLALEISKEGW